MKPKTQPPTPFGLSTVTTGINPQLRPHEPRKNKGSGWFVPTTPTVELVVAVQDERTSGTKLG